MMMMSTVDTRTSNGRFEEKASLKCKRNEKVVRIFGFEPLLPSVASFLVAHHILRDLGDKNNRHGVTDVPSSGSWFSFFG